MPAQEPAAKLLLSGTLRLSATFLLCDAALILTRRNA